MPIQPTTAQTLGWPAAAATLRIAAGGAIPAAPPDPELRDQYRYGDKNNAAEIHEHKRATATDPNDERKLPDIAQPDRGTDRRQNERKPGRPGPPVTA